MGALRERRGDRGKPDADEDDVAVLDGAGDRPIALEVAELGVLRRRHHLAHAEERIAQRVERDHVAVSGRRATDHDVVAGTAQDAVIARHPVRTAATGRSQQRL